MEILSYDHKTMEEKVVQLWNECCPFDQITVSKFRLQALFDDNFDLNLCKVAKENDEIIGFILATKRKLPYLDRGLEEEKAWINALFVKKEYRRQKVAQRLLEEVEKVLNDKKTKRIKIGIYSPNYFFAGLDPEHYPESVAFFEKNGYIPTSTHYSMGKDLKDFKISELSLEKKRKAEKEGYRFILFEDQYSLDLLEFLKEEFGYSWRRYGLNAMRNLKAKEYIFLVLNPQGKVCGAVNRAIDGNEERFGPIGISYDERNHGLGTILLECQMENMAKRGIEHMFFMTTDEDGKRYYERAGLKVLRTIVQYEKRLKKSIY